MAWAMAGIPEGEKIKALSKKTYEEVCSFADVVLVEADGSKRLPLFLCPNMPISLLFLIFSYIRSSHILEKEELKHGKNKESLHSIRGEYLFYGRQSTSD